MLFLDGKSLEAFEPKEPQELKRLKKRVNFFNRLGETTMVTGGLGTVGGLAVGLFNVVGSNFGFGDMDVAAIAFLSSLGVFAVGLPTVVVAAVNWDKNGSKLKKLEEELKVLDGSEPDVVAECKFDDPIHPYSEYLRF